MSNHDTQEAPGTRSGGAGRVAAGVESARGRSWNDKISSSWKRRMKPSQFSWRGNDKQMNLLTVIARDDHDDRNSTVIFHLRH